MCSNLKYRCTVQTRTPAILPARRPVLFCAKIILFLFIALAFPPGCTSLPHGASRTYSSAVSENVETRLSRAIQSARQNHPGESGFTPLQSGLAAFAARMALAESAERSLDIQYYIWHNDEIGELFAAALLRAADRGVRVRLLLDDWGVYDADELLSTLEMHPNIDVRLFNPFRFRSLRKIETLLSFSRINRRMHNKSFIADNQITIVGGRNIGNEYFDAHDAVNFSDFDVLAIGPLVREVSDAFDRYWNSDIAVPVRDLISPPTDADLTNLRTDLSEHIREMTDSSYMKQVRQSDLVSSLKQGQVRLYWGDAHVIYDDPEKVVTSTQERDTHLITRLGPLLQDTDEELIIISPYFIPGKRGVAQFSKLTSKGIRVRVLTNSLASNDVGLVYAGYKPYIIPMLKAGVELYEAKPGTNITGNGKTDTDRIGSSSRSSLHTKLYVFDQEKIFVGSLNLDPRSTVLNTELGIVFTNKEFGELIAKEWQNRIRRTSYQLRLVGEPKASEEDDIFRLRWIEYTEDGIIEHKVEPYVGFWRRLGIDFLGFLPIESQL
ncbi:MAG: phospholipase D family protein [Pseudomonadota bacterium]|nr:phospholipase D family protein [Pseudomonadota bacterium]